MALVMQQTAATPPLSLDSSSMCGSHTSSSVRLVTMPVRTQPRLGFYHHRPRPRTHFCGCGARTPRTQRACHRCAYKCPQHPIARIYCPTFRHQEMKPPQANDNRRPYCIITEPKACSDAYKELMWPTTEQNAGWDALQHLRQGNLRSAYVCGSAATATTIMFNTGSPTPSQPRPAPRARAPPWPPRRRGLRHRRVRAALPGL